MDVTLLDLINYKIVLFFPLPTLQISNILLYHMSSKALEISTCEFSFFNPKLPISFDSFFGFAEFFIFFSLFSYQYDFNQNKCDFADKLDNSPCRLVSMGTRNFAN